MQKQFQIKVSGAIPLLCLNDYCLHKGKLYLLQHHSLFFADLKNRAAELCNAYREIPAAIYPKLLLFLLSLSHMPEQTHPKRH